MAFFLYWTAGSGVTGNTVTVKEEGDDMQLKSLAGFETGTFQCKCCRAPLHHSRYILYFYLRKNSVPHYEDGLRSKITHLLLMQYVGGKITIMHI